MPNLVSGAVLISGVAWIIAYLDIANRGFRDKTYGMPLLPLALNLNWEFFVGFLLNTGSPLNRDFSRVCFVIDAVIVYTYFKYGRQTLDPSVRRFFLPWSLAAFGISFVVLKATFSALGPATGIVYSAWAIALVISLSFIGMLHQRRNVDGQSMIIAVSKAVGSLGPGLLLWRSAYADIMLAFGAAVVLYDAIYIVLLYRQFRQQGLNPFTRRSDSGGSGPTWAST